MNYMFEFEVTLDDWALPLAIKFTSDGWYGIHILCFHFDWMKTIV